MKVNQKKWQAATGWQNTFPKESTQGDFHPQLVLVFGDRELLCVTKLFNEIQAFYPKSHIVATSTAGNILSNNVFDQAIVLTAISFENPTSHIEIQRTNIREAQESITAGEQLGEKISKEELVHVLILSDGHLVNGSELIRGISTKIPGHIFITGGLAGDGKEFKKTVVGYNQLPREGEIVLIGFYGSHLHFGFGSVGGWDPFGIERKITRAKGNILYELDGKPALELYKMYLGDMAKELPGSALLFPLAIRENEISSSLVRTILSINEEDQSMIFAGDLPEGWYAQLMKANFDRLIDGASLAAHDSYLKLGKHRPDLAILISCIGRRLVLGQRVEDELESVQDIVGENTLMTGFYSYGEIAPSSIENQCELHNQTMTITIILENSQIDHE